MERSVDVRTGESVELRYELAGLGSRFLAVLVDFAIQCALLTAFIAAFIWSTTTLNRLAGGLPPVTTKTAMAIAQAIAIFVVFIVFFGYFIVFEVWWSGRTPGKRALGLRVVRDAGFPIDIGSAVIRNLVRVVEIALGLYAVSAITTLFSKQNKRLGDMAAATIVVRERRHEAAAIEAYLARDARADAGLSEANRTLVESFMLRRAGLDRRARALVAARLAARLRPQLTASFDHLDDEGLIEHLAG